MPYIFGYTWYPVGLASEIYPSLRTVTTGYDGAGRPNGVVGTLNGNSATYAQNVNYAAHGAPKQVEMDSNNITESTAFNHQLRTASITATTSSAQLLKLEYGYNNSADNGNVVTQTITRPLDNGTPGVWTQAYAYDNLNRLTCANETPGSNATPCTSSNPGWQQSYSYDIAGNQWAETPQSLPALTGQTPQGYAWFGSTTTTGGLYSGSQNNQVLSSEGWAYDATGNLLSIGTSLGYAYDAESRQVTAALGGSTTTYGYDGEGRRVTKQTDSGPTAVYVYDAFGNLAAEYPGMPVTAQTTYLIADALGSTRAEIQSDQVANCIDTLPFGEDLTRSVDSRPSCFVSSGWDPGEVRFTGKERDSESGLDYFRARYLSSAQGRFTSPDEFAPSVIQDSKGTVATQSGPLPYADLSDPQTINKYAYVRNNPLRFTDANGHCISGSLDTAICILAGIEVGNWIASYIEAKTAMDKVKVIAWQYTATMQRMIAVCANGSSEECTKAVETAQRAGNALPREQLRSLQAVVGLPGTLIGGPLPTSTEDLAGNGLSDLVTGTLSNDPKSTPAPKKKEDGLQKKKKNKEKHSDRQESCENSGDAECAQ